MAVALPAAAAPSSAAMHAPFAGSATPAGHVPRSALLAALKDELFSLETERLEGKLSDEEYAQLKSAFETVLKRALARQA